MEKGSDHGDNSSGVVGAIFGILSILFFFVFVIGLILGVIGLIFSITQHRKNKNKWSGAGMVLSGIGIILGILIIIAFFAIVAWASHLLVCMQDSTKPGCEDVQEQISKLNQQAGEQIAGNIQNEYSKNPNLINGGG